MSGRRSLVSTCVAIGMLLLVSAQVQAGPAQSANVQLPPVADPGRAAVVLQFFDAAGRGDVDSAMALVADNASWIGGSKCPAPSPCQGADAVRQNVQADVDLHTSFTTTEIQVFGSVVMGQFQVQSDATRAAGIDRLALTFTAQVPQDKMTVWLTQPDRTDSQTLAFLTGQTSQVAPVAPVAAVDLDQAAVILGYFDALNHSDADAAERDASL